MATSPIRRYVRFARRKGDAAAQKLATRVGIQLAAASRSLLLAPHRSEQVSLPPPIRVDAGEFDVVDDLEAYTRLPRSRVVELLQRHHESFRTEWQSFPPEVRDDHWYYLASRMYLFANAVHVHSEPTLLEDLFALVPTGSKVMDFGGGTGNLALALAASGRTVTYLELSALQRDFVRFRASRHDLSNSLEILDWWEDLPRGGYDVVVALDVLEHLPDLEETLDARLLPAINPGGLLIEDSPFVRSLSNPMHHEDGELLERTLTRWGFIREAAPEPLRAWRATS